VLLQGKRFGAVTIEYLFLVLLVIGVSGSLIGFRGNLANYVEGVGCSLEGLSSTGGVSGDFSVEGNGGYDDVSSGDGQFDELLLKGSLDDYTWDELKTVSVDLSVNGENSVYYAHMLGLMQEGSTKTFATGSSDIGEMMRVRIIGLCQDQKSDGTGAAGLTLQATHVLASSQRMSDEESNACAWGGSIARSWLNSDIYSGLPSDLKSNIVSVKKYYGSTYNSNTSDTVECDDKLFLLSARELYNYSYDDYPWYELEGTGVGHDEQYQYFAWLGVAIQYNTTVSLSGIGYCYDGESRPSHSGFYHWWLRSVYYFHDYEFWSADEDGYWYDYYNDATYYYGILPAFAI
jgi:hypothetical protein